MHNINCPLCNSEDFTSFEKKVHDRMYHYCRDCALIFMDKSDLPDVNREKERYLLHNNDHKNEGYIRFLEKALDPSLVYMTQNISVLDYGCGPNPVLAEMVISRGFSCDTYDPFFFPEWPIRKYEFIFATECFEHFFDPKREIEKICGLLQKNGYLVVMTDFWKEVEQFDEWYYLRDFTHVSFYHKSTMKFIERYFELSIIYTDNKRLIIFRKTQ